MCGKLDIVNIYCTNHPGAIPNPIGSFENNMRFDHIMWCLCNSIIIRILFPFAL